MMLLIMSSEITTILQMIQAMEEKKDKSLSSLALRHEMIKKLLDRLELQSSLLCDHFKAHCTDCVSMQHLNYQCKYSNDQVLATYNNDECYASLEIIEYMLFMGASKIIVRFAGRASEIVDGIQTIVNPIFIFS